MIIDPDRFQNQTLRSKPWGEKVTRILSASLAAADPAYAVTKALCCASDEIALPSKTYSLEGIQNVYVLAIGKAARPMARSAAEMLGDRLTSGTILTKTPELDYLDKFTTYVGGHPVPTRESEEAAAGIIQAYSDLSADDLVITMISGGGSTLLSAPAEGISLTDLQTTNKTLLNSGADIREINTIRKHISKVKGGKLAEILSPATQITLVLSDVMGDPIDMVASGPTVGDKTTYQDALDVIHDYSLTKQFPASVINHLQQGQAGKIPETPKPDDPIFDNHYHWILAGNTDAILGGIQQAKEEGLAAGQYPINPGEARDIGEKLGQTLRSYTEETDENIQRPFCLIWGGENTVTLPSDIDIGLGGRNLEMALGAVKPLHGLRDVALVTLATDGEDGLTDAAGAVVTGETFQRSLDLELDLDDYLHRHDSYPFFKALDNLLQPGSTQTNVNDLCFLFAF